MNCGNLSAANASTIEIGRLPNPSVLCSPLSDPRNLRFGSLRNGKWVWGISKPFAPESILLYQQRQWSKSIPGVNIPNRPAGQRPETAPPPDPNQFPQNGFGFMGGLGGFGGFAPMTTARFGNFTLSAAFGGLLPSLFNLQVHGIPDAAMFGPAAGFPYGFQHSYHGGHAHGYHHHHHHHHHRTAQGQQDHYLKMLFLFIIVCVIFAMIYQ
ncbi:hypothetical protein GQ457_01G009840 [Hibiscus cannabinus]